MSRKKYRIVKASEAVLNEVTKEWVVPYRLQYRTWTGWKFVRREIINVVRSEAGSLFAERQTPYADFETTEEARKYLLELFSLDMTGEIKWEVVGEFNF